MKSIFSFLIIASFLFSAGSCKPAEKISEQNTDEQEQENGDNQEQEQGQQQEEPPINPVYSPEGCIENDVVYAYMQCGSYEHFGDKSFFYDPVVKATANLCNWKADDPKGITVSWEGSASEYTVSISTPEGLWYEEVITGNKYIFKNLIPGVTYTYTVSAGGNPVKNGSFTPTGQIRMLDIPCAWNYRDEGGWTGLQGKKVKYGWIYRGSSLNGILNGVNGSADVYDVSKWSAPDSMRVIIDRIGIRAELDLRGNLEIPGQSGDNYEAHSNALGFSQFEGVDYLRIMSDYGYYHPLERSAFIQDLAFIISELKKGRPVAYHCRSGADRTGALAGLLLGLLGVSDGDIAKDYEFTSLSTEYPEKRLKLASDGLQACPNNFKPKIGIRSLEGDTVQEQYYRYVNQHFDDVHINASDIDWYIKFMLGLDSYEHPSWAKNYKGNALEDIYKLDTGSALPIWN